MINPFADSETCACCGYFAFRQGTQKSKRGTFVCEVPATTAPKTFERARVLGDSRRLVIAGATVIDPRTGARRAGATVVTGQGRILSVGGEAPAPGPDVEVLDAEGDFIVPGYNDMHSHVLELDDPSGALALMLAEGVTGFRQMSGSMALLVQRRSGGLKVPQASPALLQTPGEVLTPLNAATPDAARAEVRRQKAAGADFIKVGFISPDAFRAALNEARAARIPILGHLQEGVDAAEASNLGFRSIEHLGPGATLWLGCSSIEAELKAKTPPPRVPSPPKGVPFLRQLILRRLQTMLINPAAFASPESVERLGRASETFDEGKFRTLAAQFIADGLWHVPTLVRLRTTQLADLPDYRDAEFLRFMPKDAINRLNKVTRRFCNLPSETRRTYQAVYPRQLRLIRALADAGVRMMAGTDGGLLAAPGLSLREEFGELAKAGFTPLEILRMATCNPADYLGRADTMGAVEPGMDANLVVLSADPTEDVGNLHAISAVVRNGKRYDHSELDALKAQVARHHGRLG